MLLRACGAQWKRKAKVTEIVSLGDTGVLISTDQNDDHKDGWFVWTSESGLSVHQEDG